MEKNRTKLKKTIERVLGRDAFLECVYKDNKTKTYS